MKNDLACTVLRRFAFLATYILLPVSAIAESLMPNYSEKTFPSCAIIWEPEGAIQGKILCRPDSKIVTENENGIVSLGFKRGNKETTVQREIEHSDSVPEHIIQLVSWAQSCNNSDNCVIEDEVVEIIDLLQMVNLDEGSWRFQVSTSNSKPTYGPVTYFLGADDALIAFRTFGNEILAEENIKIFPFFVVKSLN